MSSRTQLVLVRGDGDRMSHAEASEAFWRGLEEAALRGMRELPLSSRDLELARRAARACGRAYGRCWPADEKTVLINRVQSAPTEE